MLPSPIVPRRTQDDLLGVARRFLGTYGEDLERAGKGGWDLIRAAAAMWARVSDAIANCDAQSYPSLATGPALATVALEFSRPNAAAGAVTIKAGSLVRASRTGAMFRLVADVVFSSVAVGPISGVGLAIGYGEEWNVLGRYVAPDGGVLPGEVDTIDLPLLSPPAADWTLLVTNPDPGEGGQLGILDVHGADVNVHRIPGENDANYALRIVNVADAVSPRAVRDQVRRFMDAIGYGPDDWYLVENWSHTLAGFYDAPEAAFTFHPDYDPTLAACDDPRTHTRIRGIWLDMPNAEAAGILEIRDPPSVLEWGVVCDDPALTNAELVTAMGSRATSAFDLDDTVTTCRPGALDGIDRERNQLLLRLANLVDSITAHGVNVTITAQGD